MAGSLTSLPRLYTPAPLGAHGAVTLSADQAHYLLHVLRLKPDAALRLFNGRDGEWLAALSSLTRKNAEAFCTEQLRPQPAQVRRVHLLFAPIKKARMDFLIEKAVELGATDLHPVITEHTEVRKVNKDRLQAQIIEAAEQCERLDIPVLHAPVTLKNKLAEWKEPLYAALARTADPLPKKPRMNVAILIGPEGGMSKDEINMMANHPNITAFSLGKFVLRSETAVCKALSLLA